MPGFVKRFAQFLLIGPVRVFCAIFIFIAPAGFTTCSAAAPGTLDAVYGFSANNFFVDPFQPYVYVTTSNAVKVINSGTLAIQISIPLSPPSYGMTMSPDGSKLYIAGGLSQSVAVLDTHTWNLLTNLSVGYNVQDVAMGLSNRLFVLGGRLSQIDATTGASTGPDVPVSPYSGALRMSPDRRTLYYGNFGLSPATVYKVDVSSATPTIVWQSSGLGENGEQLALSHDGSMLAYVCGYGYLGYQIPNLRTSDMSVLGVFPTGAYPDCAAYSPDGGLAFALHTIYPTAVDIYSTTNYALVGQFSVVDRAKIMTTDQTGQHLFVGFDGVYYGHTEVRVYDTGNSPPVAGSPFIKVIGGEVAEIPARRFLIWCSDPDNDPLSLSAVTSPSAMGALVTLETNQVFYAPPAGFLGDDTFGYTITDGNGGFASGTASILVEPRRFAAATMFPPITSRGALEINVTGFADLGYTVERAESLDGPWTPIGDVLTDGNGAASFTDPNPPSSSAFYRAVH
jgi:DNA-binding beta-propeller fold protein YncE